MTHDDDAPELTPEALASARRGRDVLPPEVLTQFKRPRGRPASANPKAHVSLRLDRDVLEAFRATGAGWQGRVNDILRDASRRLPSRRA
jgi:uncharacterized protein (DUF4415 family)